MEPVAREEDQPKLAERMRELARAYDQPLARPVFWGALWLLLLLLVLGALVARAGTDELRLLGAVILLAPLGLLVAEALRSRRHTRDPVLGARRAIRRIDRAASARLGSAADVLARTEAEGGSLELARLFVAQVLDGVSLERVRARGRRGGRLVTLCALGLLGAVIVIVPSRLRESVEGLDVLLARSGVGPWPLAYVAGGEVRAVGPAYAGEQRSPPIFGGTATVLSGSEIEVRMLPLVSERRFVLTDGLLEVPFVDGGRGVLVARMVVREPGTLRVAARFGDVLLHDRGALEVSTMTDRPPSVALSGAPRQVGLREMERLDLDFIAYDDVGLAAIELVFASGGITTREPLVRLDGKTKVHRGGHAITSAHPRLARASLPVTVTIEARDGDTVNGPKWGKSAAITIVPPALGHDLAERHRALREFRGALVGFVAAGVRAGLVRGSARKEQLALAKKDLDLAYAELARRLSSLDERPRASLAFLAAQLQFLGEPGATEQQAESVLLAVDALGANLARSDAERASKVLGAAVHELAVLLGDEVAEKNGSEGKVLVSRMLDALESGAFELSEMGRLGLDLGAVAKADLGRVRYALGMGDRAGARAAALHLALRLDRATPSFGARGGGVESGGGASGSGQPSSGGSASSAPSDFEKLLDRFGSLTEEHKGQLHDFERLLEEAARAVRADLAERSDVRDVIERVRAGAQMLPDVGGGPGTASGAAAQARGHAEAAARALETGEVGSAKESGAAAERMLDVARQLLAERGGFLSQRALDELGAALRELGRVTQREAGSTGAGDPRTRERALRERALAEEAAVLARRSQGSEAPLPREMQDALERAAELMRGAADALEGGRAEEARSRAERAQDALEDAMPGRDRSPRGGHEGDAAEAGPDDHVDVPEGSEDRAREFRQRVERGLSRPSGAYGEAVQRYAEELK